MNNEEQILFQDEIKKQLFEEIEAYAQASKSVSKSEVVEKIVKKVAQKYDI